MEKCARLPVYAGAILEKYPSSIRMHQYFNYYLIIGQKNVELSLFLELQNTAVSLAQRLETAVNS